MRCMSPQRTGLGAPTCLRNNCLQYRYILGTSRSEAQGGARSGQGPTSVYRTEKGETVGKTGVLGAFEELVLLALLQQGEDAYGVSIRRELEERTGSDVTMGAVYATLERIEDKGLVRPRAVGIRGETKESRRGRPRRYYDILQQGVDALDQTRRVRDTMWGGIELADLEPGEAG